MSGDTTRSPVPNAREELKPYDLEVVETLIYEHFPFDCNVIQIDAHTWAIHGTIPVGGEAILAEFKEKQDAEVALALLAAAEKRTNSQE